MSLPLFITLGRIILSPIFLCVYVYADCLHLHGVMLPYTLLALSTIGELTDFFDGFFARRHNTVTELGKIFDPMADSIFRITIFLAFTQGCVRLPLILVFVFFFRDSVISLLRTVCALRGITLAARMSGKIKAVVQAVAVYSILILMILLQMGKISLSTFQEASLYITLVAAIYTLASGVEYIHANAPYIKKALEKK